MRRLILLIGLVSALGTQHPTSGAADECDAVVKGGVFRDEKILSSQEFGQDLLDFFCTSQQSASSSALGIGLTVPVKGIPVVGNFVDKDGTFNRTEACQSSSKKVKHVFGDDIQKRYGDKDILEAWKFCIKIKSDAQANGLTCTVTVEKDSPEQVTLGLNWRPTDSSQNLTLAVETTNLDCRTNPSGVLKAFQARLSLCVRSDIKRSAKILVNTDAANVSCNLSIPSVPEPDPSADCIAAVKEKYPGSSDPRAAAATRCCLQYETAKQDVAQAEMAASQWQECSKLFDDGKDDLGKMCVSALLIPGAKTGSDTAREIALKGSRETQNRLSSIRSSVPKNPASSCLR